MLIATIEVELDDVESHHTSQLGSTDQSSTVSEGTTATA